MASKFALFYRFSDFYKRKDVIDQFPVFAGMISQEYYSDLIQLSFDVETSKKPYFLMTLFSLVGQQNAFF